MLPKVEAGRETSVAPRDAEDSEVTKDPGEGSSMGGEATEHGQWRLGLDKKKRRSAGLENPGRRYKKQQQKLVQEPP